MDLAEIFSLVLSSVAILIGLYNFWWLHWRRGKLKVGGPRSFAAFSSPEAKMVITLPFIFQNTGPKPVIIQNLRLAFEESEFGKPLNFVATVDALGKDEGRKFATQFAVHRNDLITLNCEFQREPGRLTFQARSYAMILEAKISDEDNWRIIHRFPLNVSNKAAETIMKMFIVHDNMEDI
jgi:hypothetical protein